MTCVVFRACVVLILKSLILTDVFLKELASEENYRNSPNPHRPTAFKSPNNASSYPFASSPQGQGQGKQQPRNDEMNSEELRCFATRQLDYIINLKKELSLKQQRVSELQAMRHQAIRHTSTIQNQRMEPLQQVCQHLTTFTTIMLMCSYISGILPSLAGKSDLYN